MELLAPAGNVENFHAALQAGADAVYVGAPGINARNLSRDLSLEEICGMVEFAHARGKRIYLAANSLIVERELPTLIETLALLEAIKPDGLIVQDLALIHLVRRYFPGLPLHASTLMTACNSEAVNALAAMGCQRVVLARELTLKEIGAIRRRTRVDLEVFVHGAMCYSYSGLCLFSSFLGGKSGLRGRCVQPCRRGYTWKGQGGKRKGGQAQGGGGYVFSMNDLAGFEAVAWLKEVGVTSLKIEGRLRSATYVGKIVEAYRLVLDADDTQMPRAMHRAARLAEESMGRQTSSGYFFSPQPQDAVTPQRSGNLGLHLGSLFNLVAGEDGLKGSIKLRHDLNSRDRLRIHVESTGERRAFTLQHMLQEGAAIESASAGTTVVLQLPVEQQELSSGRIELFKTESGDGAAPRQALGDMGAIAARIESLRRRRKGRIDALLQELASPAPGDIPAFRIGPAKKGKTVARAIPEVWLRTDSDRLILGKLPFQPDVFLLALDRNLLSQAGAIRQYLGKKAHRVVWALPPVVLENELGRLRKLVTPLIRAGFRSFQLGHISQLRLFAGERVHLFADYTLNLANSQAVTAVATAGCEGAQVSAELDRAALAQLVQAYKRGGVPGPRMQLGMTVYGAVPLFRSRLNSRHFQFNKKLVSPKGEEFIVRKNGSLVETLPVRPFSLLDYLPELKGLGLDYAVIDVTSIQAVEREIQEVAERLSGTGKYKKLPTFNYLGHLE